MATFQRVKIIINPASGTPEPVLSVLNEVFAPAGIEWDIALTHASGDGVTAARVAVEQGYDVVGVYGGDGTVAEVASALAQDGPPMLLLPGGTGNALADELGIPTTLADAAALVLEDAAEVRRIDLGQVGERFFVLRITMGIETALVDAATREMKDRMGWLAYLVAGVQALADPQTATYSITVDDESFTVEGVAAMVANSASVGRLSGVKMARGVDVSDGMLDVVVARSAALPSLLGSAASAAAGQEPSGLDRWTGRRIRIEASPPQKLLADGEDAGITPVDVTILPAAVGVLVPAATVANETT